jgi:hypothetical protein
MVLAAARASSSAVTFGVTTGYNGLGAEGGAGMKAVADALPHLPNLTSLNLGKCGACFCFCFPAGQGTVA